MKRKTFLRMRTTGFMGIALLLLSTSSVLITERVSADNQSKWHNPYKVGNIVDKHGRQLEIVETPVKPPDIKMAAANLPQPILFGATATLTDVPAFDWVYGCSATSAGMLAGYYDQPARGYTNIYAGPANGTVCPMNNVTSWGYGESPLVATHQGKDGLTIKGHVDDFWSASGTNVDPYYTHWTPHGYADCTGDYMGTSQYQYWHNPDGGTMFVFSGDNAPIYDYPDFNYLGNTYRDGCHGLKLFMESRGYTVTSNYNQFIAGYNGNSAGFSYNNFKEQINTGRPVLIQVTGHTMLGYGYSDPNTIAVHDTWDNSNHTMTWGGTYSGLQHFGVSIIQLEDSVGITVIAPNGGENWEIGSVHNITWTSSGVTGNVHISKSIDGGGGWSDFALNVPNTGTYSWTVTGPATALAKIRITSASDGNIRDTSENNFTISTATSKIIGANDTTGAGNEDPNYFILDKFTAEATGNVTNIRVKCGSSSNVKVAIYDDSSGEPGALRRAVDASTPVVSGWNQINITSTPVTAGTAYWLAFISDSPCVRYLGSGGICRYKSTSYSGFSFPSFAGSGFSSWSGYHLIAGFGIAPLTITTTSLPDGTIGTSYSQAVQAGGGSGSYSWSLSAGSLPAGLGPINSSTGVISGTPTTAGTSNFTVQVNDGSTTVTKALSITINAPTQKIIGASDATATGNEAPNYFILDKFTAEATGNVTNIRVKCGSSGNVKVAIYDDSSGEPGALRRAVDASTPVVSGWNQINITSTPVTAGTAYWLAFISDSPCVRYLGSGGIGRYKSTSYSGFSFPGSAGSGFSSWSGYHLIAGFGIAPLAITTSSLPDGIIGTSYSQAVQAAGGSGSYSWSLSAGSLPAGLGPINSSTGVISGTPTTAGTSNFTVQVNDGSTTVTKALSITINPPTQKIVGANDATGAGNEAPNYFILDKFTAEATGNVTNIKVKCGSSGNVKVAIYDDSSGEPGALRRAVDASTPVVSGWNQINITSTPVTAGTAYWLAFISDSPCVVPMSPGGICRYKSTSYSGFSFPGSAGSGFSSWSGYHLIAGWGTPPEPPTDPPALLSPGTAITFKWGAADRATKYHLQVNTNSSFPSGPTMVFDNDNIATTSQEVTGLSLGTTYYWRVRAGNSAGWGAWSSGRSIITNQVP